MAEADFGLGAVQSPPDARDYQIADYFAAAGIEVPVAVPTTYVVPGYLPPVINQGSSPQCVAYSSSSLKAYEDRIDQGRFFDFDENHFFGDIGGTSAGAVVRYAFDRMLHYGYPLAGGVSEAQHKIAAYYAVPVSQASIQAAILAFGPVVLGMTWWNSWFSPTSTGVLRAPSGGIAGGHAIVAIGWDSRGLRLRNSWGPYWGIGGDCWLPWAYLDQVWEVWKAVDVIETPPPSPVVLKYGGYAGYRGLWQVAFTGCRIRKSPFLTGAILATVGPTSTALGWVTNGKLANAQTTDQGSLVSGSRRWLGDATGDKWIHVSLVKLIR